MGLVRSLAFTVVAYFVAFSSEYSSTRNGFPYGKYSYIETTRDQELWISNVPFMDSLSFCFLSYVAFTMSLLLWSRLSKRGWDIRLVEDKALRQSWKVIISGAILFMLMDVIIDPVAFRGNRWFLGKIYFYAEEGEYFGIPLTNFGGWFLVGAATLFVYTRMEVFLEGFSGPGPYDFPSKALLGPILYFCVLFFNLAVTFYIGESIIGLCGFLLFSVLLALVILKILQPENFSSDIDLN
tara:strand:- start:4995 stop:5711 length:717 start_codon:yes stop_codon:yes gene_type:complete